MPASRSALRTVTVLTLTPARRNNSRVTSSSDERGCSRMIERNIAVCSVFSEGLRPDLPGCSICAFLPIRYLANACINPSITREMLFSSTPSESALNKEGGLWAALFVVHRLLACFKASRPA